MFKHRLGYIYASRLKIRKIKTWKNKNDIIIILNVSLLLKNPLLSSKQTCRLRLTFMFINKYKSEMSSIEV